MMANRIFFILLLLTCCKQSKEENASEQNNFKHSKEEKVIKQHNPAQEINQIIKNNEALNHYERAKKYIELKDYNSAKVALNESLKLEKNPIVLNELGLLFRAEGKLNNAMSYFNQSIQTDKYYFPAYINKSIVLGIEEHFDGAEETLKVMLSKCNSNYWTAYANFYLAVIYFNSREGCDKILEHFKKAKLLESEYELHNQYVEFETKIERVCLK